MTSIIELARQAGLELNWFDDNFPVLHGKLITLEQIIRADERELCAKVCDEVKAVADKNKDSLFLTANGKTIYEGMYGGALNCASVIRARGQA